MSEVKRPFSAPSRPIPAHAAAVERWALPDVAGPVVSRIRDDKKNAIDTVDLLRQALQESEARGYQAGLAKAQAESQVTLAALAARVAQLDSILQLLGQPLQQLDGEVEKELLHLTLAVGKQLARRELRVDPTQVIGIIRESLAQLPASAREIRVHLHPEDAATVRERLAEPTKDRAWTIVEDPTLSRGGCMVRTETSLIDVRLESRINAVIANALGEERAPERPTPDAAEVEE
ncbi:MAG: flagellar assembly protein FliH [Gammaproteobacteria bacterium]|nr:flagellar assembly protein FliH [Gammaproteobacteria bacterium]